jgi:phenylacetate-CoA ligase
MNDWMLRAYHALPGPARSLAASVHGVRLRACRYNRETEARVAAALEREQWGAGRWRAWQGERLAEALHRAATQVPYYREQWGSRRRRGDRSSWEALENWPILEKEPLRACPEAFVADGCDPRRMIREHTSGTTGTPLRLWFCREAVWEFYALFEARWRRWYEVSYRDRWAILGGQLVTPAHQRRPPFWVWNAGLNQLYLSVYHLTPHQIPHTLEALRRYRVRYLWGYPSALWALAQEARRLNWRGPELEVVITNAEPLFDFQREAIAAAFRCPVRETYGMSEVVAGASECASGRLHLWPEVGCVEVFAGEEPAPRGSTGDLVCTGLLNADMPLIRYRVGDRGRLPASASACGCGRALPLLEAVEGRSDDELFTADGRRIGRLDPVFKADLPVREAQIIQESLDRVRVRVVPAPEFTPKAGKAIARHLRARMGDVAIVLEPVAAIPRGANGKVRAVICRIPPEERPEWREDLVPPVP